MESVNTIVLADNNTTADSSIINTIMLDFEMVYIILNHSDKYYSIIKSVVMSTNPDDYKNINESFDIIPKLVDQIKEIKCNDILDYDRMFNLLDSLQSNIGTLIKMTSNSEYNKQALFNMSFTYGESIQLHQNMVINSHAKFSKIINTFTSALIDSFKVLGMSTDDIYLFVMNQDRVNYFIKYLIGQLISKLTGVKKTSIIQKVEILKDKIFNATRINLDTFTGIQGLLTRSNLIPMTNSMDLPELFNEMEYNYNINLTADENLRNLPDSVIVINKSNNSPIEYNMDKLLEEPEYRINPMMGIGPKVIQRANTVIKLPIVDSGSESIKRYVSGEDWVIIETINGDKYRQLGRKNTSSDENGNSIHKYFFTADEIPGLLIGVTTRPHYYNCIQGAEIFKNCFDPNIDLLMTEYESAILKRSNSSSIGFLILDKLTSIMETKLDSINTVYDFKLSIIDKDFITDTLTELLIKSKGINNSEFTLTYHARFDEVIKLFIRSLERKSINKIPAKIFTSLSKDSLKSTLLTIYKEILTATIKELDEAKKWTNYELSLKEFMLETKQIFI